MPLPTSSTTTATAPDKSKTKWDTILTATPVVLTVLATLFAGMSSSEMTLAQYRRSLAAQSQAKASDAWSYFQAKKRGAAEMDAAAVKLHAETLGGPVTEAEMRSSMNRLVREAENAEQVVKKAGDPALAFTDLHDQAVKLHGKMDAILKNRERWKPVFIYLNTKNKKEQLPAVTSMSLYTGLDDAQAKKLDDVYKAIVNEKTEEETVDDVGQLREDALKKVFANALINARDFNNECDKYKPGFEELDSLVEAQRQLAGELAKACDDKADVTSGIAASQDENHKDSLAALAKVRPSLEKSVKQFYCNFKAASNQYTARRYDAESKNNRVTATVCELQVRQHSFESEHHRKRSKFFFYTMLIAQAGVTISTLALAMRRGSVLWGLAAAAGLVAVSFGVYVWRSM